MQFWWVSCILRDLIYDCLMFCVAGLIMSQIEKIIKNDHLITQGGDFRRFSVAPMLDWSN
ncbi:hypothetical protein CWC19_02845 [Pseudoalteromonas aurantia]|uniref:Uncharacterized protein n=1 Tax=Pseudoalteromonas aurantia TaxID=43654 RepID=A0A5S3VDZ7_9GAMM|nr:hypothetical protein CWC19_02845 [Pseudoalteromonas aurantia]